MSPDGNSFAYSNSDNDSASLAVMHGDGSQKRIVHQGHVFGMSWDPTGRIVYGSQGPVFKPVTITVHIVAVQTAAGARPSHKFLTKGSTNNAFPSPSPDGKYLVFRSGRSGYKNLYIMDAEGGEETYLRQLTEGLWRDTAPAWSPDGNWIAFTSNRVFGERSFSLYLIRPNGTDLHMLLDTGLGGLVSHPKWSPDGRRLTFASNWAGVSAEPVALPHCYLPLGTIFSMNVDGSDLTRLTHSAHEDGTPSWGRRSLAKADVSKDGNRTACVYDDVWFLPVPPVTVQLSVQQSGGSLCHWQNQLSSPATATSLQM